MSQDKLFLFGKEWRKYVKLFMMKKIIFKIQSNSLNTSFSGTKFI